MPSATTLISKNPYPQHDMENVILKCIDQLTMLNKERHTAQSIITLKNQNLN
jgi:hypothetical protein